MESPKLQWSAAEVSGGVLTVPIEGERPKGWKDKFEQVVRLLGGGQWDEITCKSGKVRVSGVTDGSEDSLHHFLEGVMQEVNAAFPTADEPDRSDDDERGSDEHTADDSDRRLTESFRNFGG